MVEALEDLHFAPHALLIPLDFLLRNGLQRDMAGDVRHLGGVSMHGCMGGGRGGQDRCGRGGLGGGCEGGHGQTGGVALVKVPLFWWYVPCRAL
jgi:hypothetical protein